MNKRIKELKRQAEDYAGKYGIAHGVSGQALIDILDQTFAELIVGECSSVSRDFVEGGEISIAIKRHFGVE